MKYIVVIAFLFITLQSSAQQPSEWFVRTNANLVHSFLFEPGLGIGVGAHLGYRPVINKDRNWKPVFLLGIESVPSCFNPADCKSWWYDYNFRFQGGFERLIWDNGKERLTLGLGASIFAGKLLTGRYLLIRDGVIISEDYSKNFEGNVSPQVSLRYYNPDISERITFGYALDWVIIGDTIIHGFSIDWRLR